VSQASASQKPSLTPTMSRTSGAAHSSLTTGAVTTAASPQASSNPTSDLSSTNTTLATNSSSLYKCHLAYLEWFNGDNGPFCEPVMWQNVWVGREYSRTLCPTTRQTFIMDHLMKYSDLGPFNIQRQLQHYRVTEVCYREVRKRRLRSMVSDSPKRNGLGGSDDGARLAGGSTTAQSLRLD